MDRISNDQWEFIIDQIELREDMEMDTFDE
jgi:hypothetical protein